MVKVNDDIISKRSETLHKLMKRIALEKNSKWKGWKGEILIDDIENGILKGRNDYYKSIVLKEDPNHLLNKDKNLIQRNNMLKKNNGIQHILSENNPLFYDPHMGKRMLVKVVSNSNHTLNAIPLEIVN